MAIAITLLILDVRVGDESGKGLLHDLLHIWPTYAAYLASFLTIGIIWMNHHGFFRQVRALNRRGPVVEPHAAPGDQLAPVPDRARGRAHP